MQYRMEAQYFNHNRKADSISGFACVQTDRTGDKLCEFSAFWR